MISKDTHTAGDSWVHKLPAHSFKFLFRDHAMCFDEKLGI